MAIHTARPPRFSVVMPLFQRPEQGQRAIESVLSQSFADFELVVVDDGSPQPFRLPASAETDGRVRLIRHSENRGPSAARNSGAATARGEWVAWIDSDDCWHSDKLAIQDRFITGLPPNAIAAVATGFRYTNRAKGDDRRIPIPASGPDLFFAGCWFCPGTTTAVSRTAFREVGGYDEALRRFEDVDWFIRFGLAGGQLHVVGEVLADVSWGPSPPLQRLRPIGRALVDKMERTAGCSPAQLRDLRAFIHLTLAASASEAGQFAVFASQLAQSLALRPRLRLQLMDFWPSVPATRR
jgi:glycosyltransferase involved in cell wall biosynthesis